MRNHQNKENSSSIDSLFVISTANLTREMNFSLENRQQLFGDQASLEYIRSCSNHSNNDIDELKSILKRPAHIAKVN